MGSPEVEQAQRRLEEILQRAKQLQVPTREILSTRPARKLLTRTENAFIWFLFFGTFLLLLSGLFYVHWASQEVDTIKTVFRRACGPSGEFAERVAALLHSSTNQDEC
ncbi:uncharacterized protein [Chelonus insularis]|uniref:uncharacterized protein n=1 Tax=Chelonus insularis TaxID=460826 RepID=UPI00158B68A0|nr:uncharacterized protein LOC118073456 [Chelonus insularis]XP_034949864.1 uncharacterized protein LOC118073456 [Chelonus insularis]